MNVEYGAVLIAVISSFILSSILYGISFFTITKTADLEKGSSYECGFDPFEDTRSKFDVRFYLVAILFIIFDLEVVFLFPWSLIVFSSNIFVYWVMILFLVILTIGFIYEWRKGALDWE